jgi:hypothetical protein
MFPGKTSTRTLFLNALGATLLAVTLIFFTDSKLGPPMLGVALGCWIGCCVRWWESRSRTSQE